MIRNYIALIIPILEALTEAGLSTLYHTFKELAVFAGFEPEFHVSETCVLAVTLEDNLR
jgi:hypothetical protein